MKTSELKRLAIEGVRAQLVNAEKIVSELKHKLDQLMSTMEKRTGRPPKAVKVKPVKAARGGPKVKTGTGRKPLTAAQKKLISDRMKARWAKTRSAGAETVTDANDASTLVTHQTPMPQHEQVSPTNDVH